MVDASPDLATRLGQSVDATRNNGRVERMTVALMPDAGLHNETIFVLGATGCGKTTLIANLILLKPDDRFVIFDVKEEYTTEFFEDAIVCNGLTEFAHALNSDKKCVILRVGSYENGEETLSAACLQLMDFQKANKHRPVTVALDELNAFVSPNYASQGIQEIVQRGRGLNIRKVFGAQWFNRIPTWTRDSFSEMYVFRHCDPNGLAMLESYGLDKEAVINLPPFTCYHVKGATTKKLTLVAEKN